MKWRLLIKLLLHPQEKDLSSNSFEFDRLTLESLQGAPPMGRRLNYQNDHCILSRIKIKNIRELELGTKRKKESNKIQRWWITELLQPHCPHAQASI